MTGKAVVSLVLVAALGFTWASAGEAKKASPRRIDISVTEAGFVPDKIAVKAGEDVTLAFTRKTDKTCVTEVVLFVNDNEKVEKKLPLNQVVTVDAKFAKAGELGYACGMNMYKGVIVVQ
jgi:plastocyanin domain-containing protein